MRYVLILMLLLFAVLSFGADTPSTCRVTVVREEKETTLGEFTADVGEEVRTTKSYPIPRTKLKAKVSVYYTDESVHFDIPPNWSQDASILMSLDLVDLKEKDDSPPGSGAALAEAAIITQTTEKNLLRVFKFLPGEGKKSVVVFECREK